MTVSRPRMRQASLLLLGLGLIMSLLPTSAEGDTSLVPAASNVGMQTFEPTLGVDSAGRIFYSLTLEPGVAIGWTPSTALSTDSGASWRDVGPRLAGHGIPPETNDPYIYVDQTTGRVFQFHMGPILACSMLSYSDDQGTSWTTNPLGCGPTGAWDHQTMVASKPRLVKTVGYPNVLTQCVNAVYAEMCSRSINGGLTWSPSTPVKVNDYATNLCGTQTGHLVAAPDGTIYLPSPECGVGGPAVYVSTDDSLTWTKHQISDADTPFVDPAVSVDSAGNVYAAYIDPKGQLYFTVSRDAANTWSTPVPVAEGVTGSLPVLTAGDPGRVSLAFVGTEDLPDGLDSSSALTVKWGGYIGVSTNALDPAPTFDVVNATGSDPLARGGECTATGSGRCVVHVDFIDQVIGPNGMPYAAFVDGCRGPCATSAKPNNTGTGLGVVATLTQGPNLCQAPCWRFAST